MITITATDDTHATIVQDNLPPLRLAWQELRRLAGAKHAPKYAPILAAAEAHRNTGSTQPVSVEHVQRCARCKRFMPATALRVDVTVRLSESNDTEDECVSRDVCADDASCAAAREAR